METCPTGEDNHHNGRGRARRGTARPNIPMMMRSHHRHQEEASARPVADKDAASACLERDPPRPNPAVNSNKRSRRSRSAARRPTRHAIAEGHRFIRAQEEKKDDDEELPERLKGCDKELVKRIEQEVIDSGSPVTFEDVAGLADAKRSIQVRDPAQRT